MASAPRPRSLVGRDLTLRTNSGSIGGLLRRRLQRCVCVTPCIQGGRFGSWRRRVCGPGQVPRWSVDSLVSQPRGGWVAGSLARQQLRATTGSSNLLGLHGRWHGGMHGCASSRERYLYVFVRLFLDGRINTVCLHLPSFTATFWLLARAGVSRSAPVTSGS
jgi:hypothetical protein